MEKSFQHQFLSQFHKEKIKAMTNLEQYKDDLTSRIWDKYCEIVTDIVDNRSVAFLAEIM